MTQRFVIRMTDHSLSFALREGDDGEVAYERYAPKNGMSMAANLREAFRESQLLRRAGMSVTAMVDAPVLLVPVTEYAAEEVAEQYQYAFPASFPPSGDGAASGRSRDMLAASHVMPSLKSVAVFALPRDMRTVLTDHFDNVYLEPLMGRLWEHLLQRGAGGLNKKLYAYFHDDRMELCSFVRDRFLFANSFEAKDMHDALYFILGAWKQIGASGTSDDLFLCGKLADREALTREAHKFLRRVHYINPLADFSRAAFAQVADMPFDLMAAL